MNTKIILKPCRGWILVPVLFLAFTLGIMPGEVRAAMGALPGTGDLDFDPASNTEGNSCLLGRPPNFFDGNVIFGVSEQILSPGLRCRIVNSGEFFIPISIWVTNTAAGVSGWPNVYPADYAPSKPEPMEDFLSKLSVRLTLDGKKVYLSPGEDVASLTNSSLTKDPNFSPDSPAPVAGLVPKIYPAPVGLHAARVDWILTARHCDGLGTVPESCLDEGEHIMFGPPSANEPDGYRKFEVVEGAAQAQ